MRKEFSNKSKAVTFLILVEVRCGKICKTRHKGMKGHVEIEKKKN